MDVTTGMRHIVGAIGALSVKGVASSGSLAGVNRLKQMLGLIWPVSKRSAPTWLAFLGTAYLFWARVFLHRRKSNAVRVKNEKKKTLLDEQMHSILRYTAAEQEMKDEGDRKMPEASRVYELLWDKVQGCKVAKYGVDESTEHFKSTVGLLKDSISREMQKCMDLTEKAREARKGASPPEVGTDKDAAADAADFKAIAEHDSGEKLKSKIAFVKEVAKNLGSGIIDEQQLRDAKALQKRISAEQSNNNLALMKLIKPMWPNISFILVIAVLNGTLRGVFHQIKYWSLLVEQAAAGDVAAASGTLAFVWAGHGIIKALELLEGTWSHHAESKLGQSVRNGVLNAMVRQDFEYFYRNSPGVLQDRLNRDANELGNNIIRFPARNASRACFIVTNIVTLMFDTPTRLLFPALVPMAVMVVTMQKSFKMFNRMHQRERRVEEESIKDTSEILREIKTVRQFAMETAEAANYARAGLARHFMVEGTVVIRSCLNSLLWSFFEAGLVLTMFMGFPFLRSGQMTVTGMMDLWCKISFNIMFTSQALLSDLQQSQQLLEPVGRICDLLDAKPTIEAKNTSPPIVLHNSSELDQLLSGLEIKSAGIRTQAVASAELAADSRGANALFWPSKGQQLVSLTCADYQYVKVTDPSAIVTQKLEYPVHATFSTKLRPLKFQGKIEFRDVIFRYPTDLRKPVLNGISFTVQPGEKVALVGSTGCGKSTCMQLLQRLYDPLGGQILIDDHPIEEYDLHYLRSRIVMVDQHTVLFNASIRDNIAYGVDVSDEEIIQALKDAKIWDFVDQEPDKLLSVIAEGGSNLSGGQRQRLAIARAMVRKPDVILLDEATSALDNESEAGVQEALDVLARKGSALVIAHRLSTVMDSEKIYVLGGTKDSDRQGTVLECGTHDELLAKKQPVIATTSSTETTKKPGMADVVLAATNDDEEGSDLSRDAISKSAAGAAPKSKTKYTTYKGLWDAATGGGDEDLSASKMREKCKKLHDQWMTLQKRVDGLDRWKKVKMELPSRARDAVGATIASKDGDEALSSTKSGGTGKGGNDDDLLAEPAGTDSLARMSSTTNASGDVAGSPR